MPESSQLESVGELLNGPPGPSWVARLIHHGARVLVLIGLALAVQLLFPVAPVPDFPVLERGMIADEDIIAEVGFPILKSDDELAQEREEVAAGVPPIFVFDGSAIDSMRSGVDAFLDQLDQVADAGEESMSRARIRELLRSYGITPDAQFIDLLRSSVDRGMLRFSLERAIEASATRGVASAAALEDHAAQQIRLRREGVEQLVASSEVLTGRRFYETAASYLPERRRAELSELQRLTLIRFFKPSIRYDEAGTEEARDRARQAVTETKGDVVRGEKIVGAREQVRDAELDRLRSYRSALAELGRLDAGPTEAPRALAAFLYNAFVLGIFGALIYYFRAPVYASIRNVLLLAFLALVLVIVAAIVGAYERPLIEFIPIALPALVVAVLWDGRLALIYTLLLSVLLAGQTPFVGMSVMFTCVMAGAAASLSVRAVRSRAQTWWFIAVIALAYAAAALTLGLLRQHEWTEIGWSVVWGTISAIISGLVAMGTLPLFEKFTRLTTRQTLLELGDMEHPLLRRLAEEAPGTFSHTMQVASIAERAARAIDADALLTRVGTYYHDIGKIAKPQYFIENQHSTRNPHDRLKPSTSASIVRNHVTEGLRLAQEHRLPSAIKAFIAEHHGTQHISFFFDQAQRQNPDAELESAAFAYPGPRPQSKETAILMLADSVESAARALQDPTPDRIRDLVDRIVDIKIDAGQLEDAPLTFREIRRVKDEFASVLSGMFHQRIDYPPKAETTPAASGAAAGAGGGA